MTDIKKPLTWHLERIPLFATLMLSLIGFIATYKGFYALLSGLDHWLITFVFACVLTLALQVLLVYNVWTFRSAPGFSGKLYSLSIYVFCAIISVWLGFSFWYQAISAEDYSRKIFTQQVNASLEGLKTFEQRYGQLADTMLALSKHSGDRAGDEFRDGRTCGDASPGGPGPRMDLRQQDADSFAGFAPDFHRRRETIHAAVAQVTEATAKFDAARLGAAERIINEAVQTANVLRTDPLLAQTQAFLKKRLEEGRRPFHRQGETFTCWDSLLEAKGNIVLGVKLPELTEVAFFNPDDAKASLNRAFGLLTTLPKGLLETVVGTLPKSEEELRQQQTQILRLGQMPETVSAKDDFNQADYVPLLVGSLVDVLIFIAALGNGRGTGTNNTYLEQLDRQTQVRDGDANASFWDMLKAHVKSNTWMLELIHRYELPYRHNHYVAVPFPASDSKSEELQRLLRVLGQIKVIRRVDLRFPYKGLPSWFREHKEQKGIVFGRYVNLYELDPRFYDELVLRDLRTCRQRASNTAGPAEHDRAWSTSRPTTSSAEDNGSKKEPGTALIRASDHRPD